MLILDYFESVILSKLCQARRASQSQSKDPCSARVAEASKPFLPAPRLVVVFALTLLLPASVQAQRRVPIPKPDRVLVLKHEHVLQLLRSGKVIKEYKVALGGSPVGPKTQQGDHKTPEGLYVLDARNEHSLYYKSLHISYPTAAQRAAARKRGVFPGGDVMIHGLPPRYRSIGASHRIYDWTDGCIAVTDDEMDEIWQTVPVGTPIEIRP